MNSLKEVFLLILIGIALTFGAVKLTKNYEEKCSLAGGEVKTRYAKIKHCVLPDGTVVKFDTK